MLLFLLLSERVFYFFILSFLRKISKMLFHSVKLSTVHVRSRKLSREKM